MSRVLRCFAGLVGIVVGAACGSTEPDPTGVGGAGGAAGASGTATGGSDGVNDGSVGGAGGAGGRDASIDGVGSSPDMTTADGAGGGEDISVGVDGNADHTGTADMTNADNGEINPGAEDGEIDAGPCEDDRKPPVSPDAAPPCSHPLTRCKPQGGPASCATGICVYEACNSANQGKACKMPDASIGTCCGSICDKFDFTTDVNNCGGCGQVCPKGNCSNGACTEDCSPGCLGNGIDCGAGRVCMRPLNNPNVGACMTASCAGMADGAPCGQGVEGICCDGACVNPKRDDRNCGGCGIRCCSGTTCKGAICDSPPSEPLHVAVNPVGATAAVGDFVEMWATRVDPIVGSSDVTDDAQWTSDNPAVATVGASLRSKAIVTAIATGTAHITASVRGHSASATITVSAATLQSIAIVPSNASFPLGFLRFRALGQYSDGTSQDITELAQWGTSDAGTASIARGEAYLDTAGQTPVTASLCTRGMTTSGSTNVTVTALTVTSMAVSATKSTIKKGERTTFSAVASYSDGSTGDFTPACESWWAENADIAVPAFDRANPNDVVGIAAGTTNIECVRAQGVRGRTAITVTP
jgi:hypothetical protein